MKEKLYSNIYWNTHVQKPSVELFCENWHYHGETLSWWNTILAKHCVWMNNIALGFLKDKCRRNELGRPKTWHWHGRSPARECAWKKVGKTFSDFWWKSTCLRRSCRSHRGGGWYPARQTPPPCSSSPWWKSASDIRLSLRCHCLTQPLSCLIVTLEVVQSVTAVTSGQPWPDLILHFKSTLP